MLTNFELKQLKPKLDIVKKPENRVHELTDSNVSPYTIQCSVQFMDMKYYSSSVSQKIWLNLDHFRNCREFNSVWRISLAFANRPILHYGNGLRNIGGEAPPAQS